MRKPKIEESVIELGLLSREQWRHCLEKYQKSQVQTPIDKWLLQQKLINGEQFQRLQKHCNNANVKVPQIEGYEILEELGKGGMGIVYKAVQKDIKRLVAIKVIRGQSLTGVKKGRFLKETMATASVNHPNIVKIYHAQVENATPYMVMEYIDGIVLKDYLLLHNPSFSQRLKIMQKVIEAVEAAHSHGILHRDIKPSNILLTENGVPYLMDFGLAKLTELEDKTLTKTGQIIGTPRYMSPEQARGETHSINKLSDVYSLGTVFFEAITDTPLVTASSVMNILHQVIYDHPTYPCQIDPSIPAEIETICLKALEKKKENRYQTAQEMARDIELYLQGKAIKTRGASRFKRWAISHLVFVFFLSACLIFTAFGTWHWWQKRQIERQNLLKISQVQLIKALSSFEKNQLPKALEQTKMIIVRAPEWAPVHLLMARIYWRQERITKARSAFKKAYKISSKDENVLFSYANFCYEVKNFSQALELINKCIAKKPGFSEYFHSRAAIYKKLNQAKKAQKDLQYAKELEKQHIKDSLAHIQKIISNNKKTEQPLFLLNQLIKQYPRFVSTYVTRARLFYLRGEIDKSIADISRATELSPTFDFYMLRGKWLLQAQYFGEAIINFLESLKKIKEKPKRHILLEKLADAQFLAKEYRKSYLNYQRILGKKTLRIRVKMAKVAFYQKLYLTVKEHIKILEKNAPGKEFPAKAYYYRGIMHANDGNFSQAIEDLAKAESFGITQKQRIYYHLGNIYLHQGEVDLAGTYLEKAQKAFPKDTKVLSLMGKYFFKLKNYAQAIAKYNQCIKLEPWIAKHYLHRGEVYSRWQRYHLSEPDYLKCLELEVHNFAPVINLVHDLMRNMEITKINDTRQLISSFVYKAFSAQEKNLFLKEYQKISAKHIQKHREIAHKIVQKKSQIKQVKVFIKALSSDSEAVLSMAKTRLVSTYHSSKIYALIEQKAKEVKFLPRIYKRFEEVFTLIAKKRLEHYKILMRQLLVRCYVARDQIALRDFLSIDVHKKGLSTSILKKILYDPQENSIVRFFAASALLDLRTLATNNVLVKSLKSPNMIAQVFSWVVLKKAKLPTADIKILTKAANSKDPFVRSIVARYIPLTSKDTTAKLLQDGDIRVQLYMAGRLWEHGNLKAQKILVDHFENDMVAARLYTHATFWNFAPLRKNMSKESFAKLQKKCVEQYLDSLIKATKDVSAKVQVVAVNHLGFIRKNSKAHKALQKLLKSSNSLVRFQTIGALTRWGESKDVNHIIINPREPIIHRAAATFGGFYHRRNATTFSLASKLLQDKDFRVRVFAIKMGAEFGKDLFEGMLRRFLQSSDTYTCFGALVGLLPTAKRYMIPQIKKRLINSRGYLQRAAATTLIAAMARYELTQELKNVQKHIHRSRYAVQGAAYGYMYAAYEVLKLANFKPSIGFDRELLYQDFIERLLKKAKGYKAEKRKLTPETLIANAISLAPDNSKYHFEKGIFYYGVGKHLQSVFCFEKAVQQKRIPIHLDWLARGYFKIKRFPQALIVIEQMLQMRPWNYHAVILKGKILRQLLREKEARNAFSRAYLIKPHIKKIEGIVFK